MSNDIHSSTDGVLLAGQSQLKLTYGEFLQMAKERRLAELEHSNPGEDKRNANIAGNIVRAIRAFMAANGIRRQDVIGEEMLDQTTWEEARDRLGPAKAPEKSLAGKARVWALEELRLEETRHADETFGTRLARLRCLSGLNYSQLSSVVSTGAHRTRWNVIRNWEEGVRRPAPESLAVVQRLEKALNAPQAPQNDPDLLFSRILLPRLALDAFDQLVSRVLRCSGFLVHLRSLMAAMNQKSSLTKTSNLSLGC